MITKRLDTYSQFIKAGRPYTPVYDPTSKRLLLPNFAVNGDSTAYKNKKRLVISSGTVYNTGDLCAVWVCCTSCVGFRSRWLFYKNLKHGWFRVYWHELSTYEKAIISRAYVRRMDKIEIQIAPSKHYKELSTWL